MFRRASAPEPEQKKDSTIKKKYKQTNTSAEEKKGKKKRNQNPQRRLGEKKRRAPIAHIRSTEGAQKEHIDKKAKQSNNNIKQHQKEKKKIRYAETPA
jgi:hypothetical protein